MTALLSPFANVPEGLTTIPTSDEIKLILDMRRRNPDAGLVVFWEKLMQRGYSRSIPGLSCFLKKQEILEPKHLRTCCSIFQRLSAFLVILFFTIRIVLILWYTVLVEWKKYRKECDIMPLPKQKIYTIDDIYNLPEGHRAELIDGQIYDMVPPSRRHQDILSFLHLEIGNYIRTNSGPCKIYPAPFAVFLNADDVTYVEPDISVVCDPDKLDDKGCKGAPDWVIEIVSPSSRRMDYYTKISLYRAAGVREYWIVDPLRQTIVIYDMEHDGGPNIHSFTEKISVNIFDNLQIDFSNL